MRTRHQRTADLSVPPLDIDVQRQVRFEEIDPLNIMWHGHYASWLEDGREALGKAHGIHYLDFYHQGVTTPIKLFQLEYHHPLHYGQSYTIRTSLLWNDAALLDIQYTIRNEAGTVMTTGCTTQLMLNRQGELLLEQPLFFREFRARWQAGALST